MRDKVESLFERQMASWPMLRQGIARLKEARIRPVDVNGYPVFVRHLPHRMASTTAAVDRASIEKRPCFLCAANLPPEEEGLAFNSEFTIYCNPFPILDRHITIVHNAHRPQRIAGQIDHMVAIAESLPGYLVVYNGPQCGASAPDHLHFQACASRGVPLIDDVRKERDGSIPNYARRNLIFHDVASLRKAIGEEEPEPLLNLAVFRDPDRWTAVLFPRKKHRPSVFHTGEFTVSPAAMDLCGVFVTPVELDFERITGEDIRRIYEEVG
jgi:Domain of unknown function (DUF4922)